MQLRDYKIESDAPYLLPYKKKDVLFFDIETTGLSASSSYLYLIGCIYYKEDSWHLKQWFSDGIEEEKEVIKLFFEFLKNYKVLVHYNGQGFDIPYLLNKVKRYKLRYDFDSVTSLDIYKEILPYKKLLSFENLKQKTVEAAFGLNRLDTFSGGDLIAVYTSYVGKHQYEVKHRKLLGEDEYKIPKHSGLPSMPETESEKLLYVLLLHNADDLKGLLAISNLITYKSLFGGEAVYESARLIKDTIFCLHATLPYAIPAEVLTSRTLSLKEVDFEITLRASKKDVYLLVPLYRGSAKYFYPDYKDYYYLPEEDKAIHKSVAEFVEKDYRVKAKPENCYLKKEAVYLPQSDDTIQPAFRFTPKDKAALFELTQEWLIDQPSLQNYLSNLIKRLFCK